MPPQNVIDDPRIESSERNGRTDWEDVATSKWGTYVSEMEKASILEALSIAAEPALALDVGCDRGRWSQLVHAAGWNVVCTDIYPGRLESCKTRIPSARCILVDPKSSELPCQSGSIGLILAIEVSFVTHSDWFIPEAYRVLQAGGLLVVVTFNLLSWRGLLAHVSARLRGSYDYYNRCYTSYKKQLQASGLKLRHETGFCWFPFSRASNSPLIPFAIRVENALGLRRIVNLSPWVACIAQKLSAE